MSMRIALYGASGTGKTTLARCLAELLGLELNPVGSRSVSAAMGFASPYDVDAAGKRAEFQRRLLAEKLAWERDHDAFVTDRTPLDNIAYTALHAVDAVDSALLESALIGLRRYTDVVFCPMSAFHRPGDDPARLTDPTYHRIFETLVRAMVVDELDPLLTGPRSHICSAYSIEDRQDWARTFVQVFAL